MHDVRRRVGERVRDPIFWSDATQLLKTVVAGVLAWLLAASVLGLQQPFLAPWSALLVVHATVYRTFSQGLRQVTGTVLGVLVAWAVGNAVGLDTAAVAVALVVGLAVGTSPWFQDQETLVATTALVVLTTGFSDNDAVLLARLLDTAVGIGVGLAVNLLVWPPLLRRSAITALDNLDDRIGALMRAMSHRLVGGVEQDLVEEWVEETRDIDEDIDRAWSLVRQARESARMNPRRSAREVRDPKTWYDLLRRMEQATAEVRSMARTLGLVRLPVSSWDPAFLERWPSLLHDAGRAIADADEAPLLVVRAQLDDLAEQLRERSPAPLLWPEYGALVVNLRNIVAAMDAVAEANPLGRPPLPFSRRRRASRPR